MATQTSAECVNRMVVRQAHGLESSPMRGYTFARSQW